MDQFMCGSNNSLLRFSDRCKLQFVVYHNTHTHRIRWHHEMNAGNLILCWPHLLPYSVCSIVVLNREVTSVRRALVPKAISVCYSIYIYISSFPNRELARITIKTLQFFQKQADVRTN